MTFWSEIEPCIKRDLISSSDVMITAVTSSGYLFSEPGFLQLLLAGVTEQQELLYLVSQISLLSVWPLLLFPKIAGIILSETKNGFISLVRSVKKSRTVWWQTVRLTSDSLSVLVSLLAIFFFSSRALVSSAIFWSSICFSSALMSPCSCASFLSRRKIWVSYMRQESEWKCFGVYRPVIVWL